MRLSSKGLMLLILSDFFISCKQNDNPIVTVDFHSNIFEVYINKNDTIGVLKNDKDDILRRGKSHIALKNNTLYFTMLDYQLISYDMINRKVIHRFELNSKFNIGVKLKQINKYFLGLSSDKSLYILDEKLNIRISPLDSIFLKNRLLKETSKPEWYYSVSENQNNIQIHIPQFNGHEVVQTFKL